MSAGSRQEVMIRSLLEGLCLVLKRHFENMPRHKVKVTAIDTIMRHLETFWQAFPVELEKKEALRVTKIIEEFHESNKNSPLWGSPEVLISFVMALMDHPRLRITNVLKKAAVGEINHEIQALYDTFDRQGAKMALMEEGGRLADRLLAQEI